ncbi:MAG: hypothetical protein ACR2G4_18155 [Pyrinomonadaceae bacterium]
MNDDRIDLNDLANRHQLSIVPREDPDQRDSRIRLEEANAAHQRRKDLLLLSSALVVIGVTLCPCVWAIVREGSNCGGQRAFFAAPHSHRDRSDRLRHRTKHKVRVLSQMGASLSV